MSDASQTNPGRLADVDALRGFALLGILAVNITAFASTYYGSGVPDPAFDGPLDRAVSWGVAALFESKFYLLFSFLFGYSFTLQMDSAARAGAAFLPRMVRRHVGLWLIGILHAVLLFHGDILTAYALLGMALLALRKISDRRALKTAAVLVVLTSAFWAGVALLQWLGGDAVDAADVREEAARATAAYRSSPAGVIRQHLRELPATWFVVGTLQVPCALAMFLVGLVAGRRRVLADPASHRTLLRRLARVGLLVGLPGGVVYATTATRTDAPWLSTLGLSLGWLTAPLLSGAYGALVLLGFQTRPGRRAAAALAPAGRMALSNYLLQSLACSLVFTAYGLGLTGRLSPPVVALVALGVFLAQLPLSAWWLRSHAYGPLEWLLRALTLASFPAWRKGPRGSTPAPAVKEPV